MVGRKGSANVLNGNSMPRRRWPPFRRRRRFRARHVVVHGAKTKEAPVGAPLAKQKLTGMTIVEWKQVLSKEHFH